MLFIVFNYQPNTEHRTPITVYRLPITDYRLPITNKVPKKPFAINH